MPNVEQALSSTRFVPRVAAHDILLAILVEAVACGLFTT